MIELLSLNYYPSKIVTELRFGCSLLQSQYLSVGKERLLYSGGRQPERKVDSCPKAHSPLPIRGQELLKGSFRGV